VFGKLTLVAGGHFRRFCKPSHLEAILKNSRRLGTSESDNKLGLESAMQWLCRAQDITGCGGVSGGYNFDSGWLAPYPETTGYIIPTFLRFASEMRNQEYLDRAVAMGEWESDVQLESGAVRGRVGLNDYPIVFNTGQVMIGWNALYRMTGKGRFLDCSRRAAKWLVSIQEEDGRWVRHTYSNRSHAYHTRVAWPLLQTAELCDDAGFRGSAVRNLQSTLSLTADNGWIHNMAFDEGEIPLTHTVAYTLRGLLESAQYLDDSLRSAALSAVSNAALKLLHRYERNKTDPYSMPRYMSARFNEKWKPGVQYSCLTGNCQIAIVWMRLYQQTGDFRYLNSALKMNDQVEATQNRESSNPDIAGAIAGSYPIWGDYVPFTFPNWAAKFFADSIMLQEEIMQAVGEPPE
jgi:hypothetical protein